LIIIFDLLIEHFWLNF